MKWDDLTMIPLVSSAYDGRYLPSGHLLFARAGAIIAVPFDADELGVTGEEVVVGRDVAVESWFANVHAATSANGTLAYVSGRDLAEGQLAWVDRHGDSGLLEVPDAECLPEELEKELDAVLMALSFFCSREIAEIFYSDAATGHQSFEAMADAIHRVVPRAVAQYAHMGRSIATVLAEPDWDEPERTYHAKIARNEPCPCGSGKNYKNCCEVTAH